MEMNRTVIYARLSREDEDKIDRYKESRSIENQIKILKEYATNHNLDLKKIILMMDILELIKKGQDFKN